MGKPITEAQEYWLRQYFYGGSISQKAMAFAPIRRLIKRNLIERTGTSRLGRPYFNITDAGRAALRKSQGER